jgi:hypothetical protein
MAGLGWELQGMQIRQMAPRSTEAVAYLLHSQGHPAPLSGPPSVLSPSAAC